MMMIILTYFCGEYRPNDGQPKKTQIEIWDDTDRHFYSLNKSAICHIKHFYLITIICRYKQIQYIYVQRSLLSNWGYCSSNTLIKPSQNILYFLQKKNANKNTLTLLIVKIIYSLIVIIISYYLCVHTYESIQVYE